MEMFCWYFSHIATWFHILHTCEQRGKLLKRGKMKMSSEKLFPTRTTERELTFLIILIAMTLHNFRLQRKSHNFTKLSMLINLLNYLLHNSHNNGIESRTFNNSISIRLGDYESISTCPWSSVSVEHYEISYLREMEKWSRNALAIILITLNISGIH